MFLFVVGAVLAGAEKIIAVDLMESRLEHARRIGATHAVNASAGDPVAQVRDLTGRAGVDYVFEVTIPSLSLVYEERVLTGSLHGSAAPKTDIPRLIDLYRAGRLKLDELLTRSYPIEEMNQAYDALERGETLQSVVTF